MLREFLEYDLWRVMIVFTRLSGIFLQIPFFSEQTLPQNVRLAIAVFIAISITPAVTIALPAKPALNEVMLLLILTEATIGVFIGLCFRFVFEILQIAGYFISMQTGFQTIQFLAPGLVTPSVPHSALMTLLGLMLILVGDLHLLMIEAIINSYTLFPPSGGILFDDFAQKMIELANESFIAGFQISAVFFVLFIPINFYFGVIGRLMPQVQSQILLLPIQVLVGTIIFGIMAPPMSRAFLIEFDKIFELFGVAR